MPAVETKSCRIRQSSQISAEEFCVFLSLQDVGSDKVLCEIATKYIYGIMEISKGICVLIVEEMIL